MDGTVHRVSATKALLMSLVVFCAWFFTLWHMDMRPRMRAYLTLDADQPVNCRAYYSGNDVPEYDASRSSTATLSSGTGRIKFSLPRKETHRWVKVSCETTSTAIRVSSLEVSNHLGSESWREERLQALLVSPSGTLEVAHPGESRETALLEADISGVYRTAHTRRRLVTALVGSLAFSGLFLAVLLRSPFLRLGLAGAGFADGVLSFSFIVLISIPSMFMWTGIEVRVPGDEQRKLAERPKLRLGGLSVFPEKYMEYFNDNFGLRKLMVRYNNMLQMHIVDRIGDVVLGDEKWMFYAGNDVLEDHKGEIHVSDEQLDAIAERLVDTQKWLNARGTEFLFVISPNKHTIYGDAYLPRHLRGKGGRTCADQVVEYLQKHTQVNVLDLRGIIKNASLEQLQYFKTDTHWNSRGAFLAYQEVIKRLRETNRDIPLPMKIEDMDIKSDRRRGDMAGMLLLNDIITEEYDRITSRTGWRSKWAAAGSYGDSGKSFGMVFFEMPDYALPRAVFFGDSFYEAMVPFLAEHFSRSAYLWVYDVMPDIVEEEAPDVVVLEMVERMLLVANEGTPRGL